MKINTSLIACISGAALLCAGPAFADGRKAAAPVNISQQALPVAVSAGDYELINQVIDLPPGSGVPNHSHGGPVVVDVVSGEITLFESGKTRTLKAGQSWTEDPGFVHAVANRGKRTVRLSVSYLIPKGAAQITIVK